MRFAATFAAVMALASSALAQTANFDPIIKPGKDEKIPAGSKYEITWETSPKWTGPVTISLIGGKTEDTQTPQGDIATGVNGDSYSWDVKSSLGSEKVYGLVIKLESDPKIFQYSFPFEITGGSDGAVTTQTKSHGIKTVTLSSSSVSSTSTTPTPTSTSTSTSESKTPTTTPSQTTASPSVTQVTSTVVVPVSTEADDSSAPATSSPAASPTGAAAAVGAPMALVAGLAVAIFAL